MPPLKPSSYTSGPVVVSIDVGDHAIEIVGPRQTPQGMQFYELNCKIFSLSFFFWVKLVKVIQKSGKLAVIQSLVP